jgi:hypothetical protein
MPVVISALAGGAITPGEAATIAAGVDTLVLTIGTTKRREFAGDLLQTAIMDDF